MNTGLLLQILVFILLIVIALIAGALLAYPLQLLLPDAQFSRLAERSSLLCGLLVSLLYMRRGMPLSLATIGYQRPAAGWWPTLLPSYGIGIIIMLVPALLLWQLGLSRLEAEQEFTLAFLAALLFQGLTAGIGASLIEETLFRGALFSGLQQRINATWAVILSSLLYSAVHFIEYPEPAGVVHWYTGLELFPAALAKFAEIEILSHFMTLFLLGVLLAVLRWRDGHIWRAFALHAGIIMAIKLNNNITDKISSDRFDFLVSDYSGRLGWLTAVWLLIIIVIYSCYCYRSRQT